MVQEIRKFYNRKAIKVGNSAGVLLPRALLGADVRVVVLNPAGNVKRDIMRILEPVLEDILGVYFIKKEGEKSEILAVSTKIRKTLEKTRYKIDVVPLIVLKKSLREGSSVKDKIKNAKVVINKKLLKELQ